MAGLLLAAGIAYKRTSETLKQRKEINAMINDNTKEELKAYLPQYVEQITRRSKGGLYNCPLCNSGTGRNKTGAFSIFDGGKAWHCLSCEKGGDIFKLIELVENKPNFTDQVERAAEIAGMRIENTQPMKQPQPTIKADPAGRYAEYIAKCHAAINETDYFKKRGFTDEAIERFNLGYDSNKKVVVIPYDKSGNYYITRSISDKVFRKPDADEAGPEPIFNKAALYEKKPCFVCESPIDAISILSISDKCNAIALGGTGSEKLKTAVTEKRPNCILILNFDNDEPGRTATEKAAEKLTAENIDFIIAKYPADAPKDANEMLIKDVCQLMTDTAENVYRAERKAEEAKAEKLKELNATKANNLLADFIDNNALDTPCVKTGFNEFDAEMDGGLYPGLYILGAISSMGKTTFMLQLADQIAGAKKDVLYFTLEMGSSELMARSISRYSYIAAGKCGNNAVYTRSITNVEKRDAMTAQQRNNYNRAIEEYKEDVANNLWYFESIGDIGIEEIRKQVKKHYEITGHTPIIFIDYLQIMKPINETLTEKRNTDKAVLELRKLAREYNTTIFVISSLNRSSYKGDITMDAFKESGAIEYGSDVLLGLQPRGMAAGSYKKDEKKNIELVEDTKAAEKRELELKVLKNRTGRTGQRIKFAYNAKFNYFEEEADAESVPGWEPAPENNRIF